MAWLGTWQYRRKITISNANVDAILSGFPILVKISASSGTGSTDITSIFTELTADANRKKIAVTISDGTTQCYVEIERWDHANSLAWLWVKVPSVASGSVTELYIYYDVAQANNTTYVGDTTNAAAQSVWDANFKLVMHMAQDPNGDPANAIKDSTSNVNHGTPAGSMTSADLVDGKVGKGIDFDSSDDAVVVVDHPSLDLTNAATVEIIAKTNSASEANLASKGAPNQNSYGICRSSSGYPYAFAEGGNGQWGNAPWWIIVDDALISDNVWTLIAFLFDGTDLSLYRDGVYQDKATNSGTLFNSSSSFTIGYQSGWATGVNGIIDEVRISNIARSAAWIKATYYSNWDGLVSYGAEEETSGWTGKIFGVSNPGKVLGISSTNIAKILGV